MYVVVLLCASTALTVSPVLCVCAVSGPQHFSISNAGSSSSSGKTQTRNSGNGQPMIQETAPPSRKFSEGPLPVIKSSNEPVGGVGGSGTLPATDDSSGGVISEGANPNKEGLVSMKPPNLPPPSKFKEPLAMPPPPSLPPRFAKGVCK